MSKLTRRIFRFVIWFCVIVLIVATPIVYLRVQGELEYRSAETALAKAIFAIATDSNCDDVDVEIRTSLFDNASELSEDFAANYRITGTDYSFGTWDFYVEFPDSGMRYYFAVYYDQKVAKWQVRIKPSSPSLRWD